MSIHKTSKQACCRECPIKKSALLMSGDIYTSSNCVADDCVWWVWDDQIEPIDDYAVGYCGILKK